MSDEASVELTPPPGEILVWEMDPFSYSNVQPRKSAIPVIRPIPDLASKVFPIKIRGEAPPIDRHVPGTLEYRYWTAAEALRRCANFWGEVGREGTEWNASAGETLEVFLDKGIEFNAAYDRTCLVFQRGAVDGGVVYSGESPDILCHEMGHAILDAIRPQLWNAALVEVAAFHESFGDISSLLSALQIPSVREQAIMETRGNLYRTSRLSRFAEQLGWAIRQNVPDRADPDCLRNAVNSFFYQSPDVLPPNGPSSILTSEPHNFSRVFTGGFFESLAFMFRNGRDFTSEGLKKICHDAGYLLVEAVMKAPVVPDYYSQVAAVMIELDKDEFGGKYQKALSQGFKRHGILAPEGISTVTQSNRGVFSGGGGILEANAEGEDLDTVKISFPEYGLGIGEVRVYSDSQAASFHVSGAAPNIGSVSPSRPAEASRSFVEDLVRLGRVELAEGLRSVAIEDHPFENELTTKTHRVVPTDEGLTLERVKFDCGFDS